MEEDSAENKHEEMLNTENNILVENIETFEGLTQAESVQHGKEENETFHPYMSETVEDDVMYSVGPQEGVVTKDIIPSDASVPDISESGPHVVTEEEAGLGSLINEAISETEGSERYFAGEEGTMTAEDEDVQNKTPVLDPCMPDGERSSPPEEPLVLEKEIEVNHIEYKDVIHELQEESDELTKQNVQLQTKISECLSRNAGNDKHPKPSKHISDQEQYQKYMDLMEDMKFQNQRSLDLHQQCIEEELCQQSQEKLNQVEHELRSFALLKNEAAVKALTGKVGRQATLEKVEQLLADEQKKENEVACVRLNSIKLKNKVCKLEAAFHSQQQLADGLLLMDFEQLKTENQTFKEKFKERGEELLRLKNKIACSVQGITHMKEKMHFVQIENIAKRTELAEADASLALKRDVLTHTRQARDNLRTDNLKLQQRCGLLGNTTLLRDFEERVDTSECLQQRLETLKRRHAELVLKCAGVKLKIEQSKPEYK
ncbi:coiled-coil domain-containing protein 96 [Triplophysa dalaica]|uniref:coiled-coil domain-containing protein 96 n=1 Tax=Triplophysa dalaica TaxID=1582913 RepID=UPI0024DFE697|nr:coiled-coil domain-containing protein 96 [Triplophysa dalaica]